MKSFFRGLSFCPLVSLHMVGWVLGWLSFLLSPTYRRRFLNHARQASMDWSDVKGAVGQAGQLLSELPFLWMRASIEGFSNKLVLRGAEVIRHALAQGQGIVFLTPHLGSFEVAAQAYAEYFGHHKPITVLYRPARKPWLRHLIDASRARPGLNTAPASLSGVRQMLKALRHGAAVGLLPDQVPPLGMGVWAPFFGRSAYTMTLAARLVQQTGATVVLAWCRRLPWGQGYELTCEPMSEAIPSDPMQRVEAATMINRAMERLIRRCPQQYLWGYHRYKEPAAILQVAEG
ncbi:MAG: lysophospholipid acyltransferase family protein [Burkholderiales bacterium]